MIYNFALLMQHPVAEEAEIYFTLSRLTSSVNLKRREEGQEVMEAGVCVGSQSGSVTERSMHGFPFFSLTTIHPPAT